MEIDLTTLILEIVNFLVLVWLLKRFLYQPVLNIVRKRQQDIQARLDEAEKARTEAEQVRKDYETRMAAIETEHREAMKRLDEELQARRSKALQEIRNAAELEEKKLGIARQAKDDQWRRETEQQSLLLATRFVSRILRVVADDYLHQRLTGFALDSLAQLKDEEIANLRASLDASATLTVHCAFPLVEDQRDRLQNWAREHLGVQGALTCTEDKRLIAGIRVAVGNWSLGFNLADELKGFADCIHGIHRGNNAVAATAVQESPGA